MTLDVQKHTIVNLLRQQDMGTKELRAELGKYPRKQCNLLEEAGVIGRYKEDGRIWFHLEEDDEELDRAVEVNTEIIEEAEKEEPGRFTRFIRAIKNLL